MRRRSGLSASIGAVLSALVACADPQGGPVSTVSKSPLFVEVAQSAGFTFVHANGASGRFYYPELMHSGSAFLDYDRDGHLDVYLVQAGSYPGGSDGGGNANSLYRSLGDGTFEDTTVEAGVGDLGYGAGVAIADYDGDGDLDLYVTNLGRNTLYRNDGSTAGGSVSFTDVTDTAAVGDDGYSTSAAFLDYDRDGDLDLYVCNYIDWSPEIERPCLGLSGLRGYCGPDVYDRPQADTLYRNQGDGTFADVSASSGVGSVAATGLGIATADFNGDGWLDIYVANDQMANLLWINQGDGGFRDEALGRGCALNGIGVAEASMGVAAADPDQDGDWDLFMVHLSGESNTFYRNVGEGSFYDATDELGLGAVSRPYTGFGTAFFDYDCDGFLDLFIANGKVRMGDRLVPDYAEPNQLLRGGPDGRFHDVSEQAGEALELLEVSRGAAFGDYDNDGDIDVLISNNEGPVRLLRNQACGDRHWLSVELVGRRTDRNAIGAVVRLEVGTRHQQRTVQPAYSYSSSNDPRLHFGLGAAKTVERLTVRWPDGRLEEYANVAADQFLVFEEQAAGPADGRLD